MSETRKLVAILVADVVGYSRLAGADEDRTARAPTGTAQRPHRSRHRPYRETHRRWKHYRVSQRHGRGPLRDRTARFRAFYPSREATIDLRAWPAAPRPVLDLGGVVLFAERAQLVEGELIDQPDHVFALCVVSCVALQGGRLGALTTAS